MSPARVLASLPGTLAALAVLAAAAVAPPEAAAQSSAEKLTVELELNEFGLHTLDGLEDMARPAPATLPKIFSSVSFGVSQPLDRRFKTGGETTWRAGYRIAEGLYLGGGVGMVVQEGEPFRALPEATLFQFQALVSLDWIFPLRPSSDPYGLAPALRLSVSPGFVGGDIQERRGTREDLRELNQQVETSLWGGLIRAEAAFDLPLVEIDRRALFLSFGLSYQWGLARANFKLRDKSDVNPTIDDTENVRLDAISLWVGVSVRF